MARLLIEVEVDADPTLVDPHSVVEAIAGGETVGDEFLTTSTGLDSWLVTIERAEWERP